MASWLVLARSLWTLPGWISQRSIRRWNATGWMFRRGGRMLKKSRRFVLVLQWRCSNQYYSIYYLYSMLSNHEYKVGISCGFQLVFMTDSHLLDSVGWTFKHTNIQRLITQTRRFTASPQFLNRGSCRRDPFKGFDALVTISSVRKRQSPEKVGLIFVECFLGHANWQVTGVCAFQSPSKNMLEICFKSIPLETICTLLYNYIHISIEFWKILSLLS